MTDNRRDAMLPTDFPDKVPNVPNPAYHARNPRKRRSARINHVRMLTSTSYFPVAVRGIGYWLASGSSTSETPTAASNTFLGAFPRFQFGVGVRFPPSTGVLISELFGWDWGWAGERQGWGNRNKIGEVNLGSKVGSGEESEPAPKSQPVNRENRGVS